MSQQPCLPVPRRRKRDDGGGHSFKDIEKMDAMEYMSAVMSQASSLPDVFVAEGVEAERTEKSDHVPIDGSAASLAYMVSTSAALLPPPTNQHAPPSRTWVDQTLSNFSELRSYLEKCKSEGIGGKGADRIPVPPMKDRSGWHVFCVGLDDARGNSGSYFGEDEQSDCYPGEPQDDVPRWKQKVPLTGYEPGLRLVLQMDQVMVRRVLSHLAYYIQEGWSPTSKQRSTWIYALLARLERPLHRDDAAILYGLLKDLTAARYTQLLNCAADKEALSRLNLLIAIIGVYFEQGGGYSAVMDVSVSS